MFLPFAPATMRSMVSPKAAGDSSNRARLLRVPASRRNVLELHPGHREVGHVADVFSQVNRHNVVAGVNFAAETGINDGIISLVSAAGTVNR